MKISVLMPMFNEQDIVENTKVVEDEIKKTGLDYEIIIVDDCSTNDCYSKARSIPSKKVKVITYKPNNGKGYALMHGFKHSTGDYVMFIDSDLDLHPRTIHNFLEYLPKYDIVIGSKRHPESKVHYPIARKILSRATQLAVKTLFNLNVKDTQVGLKLFKREVLEKVVPKILVKRWAFDLELLVVANKEKYKIIERPIELNFKFSSTIKPQTIFYSFLDMLAIFYRLKILRYYDQQ
ncbi:MAG: glycosyltransferase [Nanoarchaeota archaeon]|nr:glycosyltransferase [Nanoarchaeota archaeon]